jgi:hypothetical protein
MFKRVSSTQQRLLGERLRREAMESRPAFSESLHRRIVCAVKQHHAAVASLVAGPTVSRRWPRVLAAALAACVLCAAAIGWQLVENASRQGVGKGMRPVHGTSLADLPSINDLTGKAVGRLDNLTVSATLEPQTTPLKHDARSVASVFLDRLPIDVKLVNNR